MVKVKPGKKGLTVAIDEADFLYMEKKKREVNGTSRRVGMTWADFLVHCVKQTYPEKKAEQKIEDLWSVD